MEHVVHVGNVVVRLSDVVCLEYSTHHNHIKIMFRNCPQPVVSYGCSSIDFHKLSETWKDYTNMMFGVGRNDDKRVIDSFLNQVDICQ